MTFSLWQYFYLVLPLYSKESTKITREQIAKQLQFKLASVNRPLPSGLFDRFESGHVKGDNFYDCNYP